jgi:hypothetical protein
MAGFAGRGPGGRAALSAGVPLVFRWRGRSFRIEKILDVWKDTGEWWDGEEEKTFVRVLTAGGGTLELFRRGLRWHVYKAYD